MNVPPRLVIPSKSELPNHRLAYKKIWSCIYSSRRNATFIIRPVPPQKGNPTLLTGLFIFWSTWFRMPTDLSHLEVIICLLVSKSMGGTVIVKRVTCFAMEEVSVFVLVCRIRRKNSHFKPIIFWCINSHSNSVGIGIYVLRLIRVFSY